MKNLNKLKFIALLLTALFVNFSCNKGDLHDEQNLQESENFVSKEKALDVVSKFSWSKTTVQKQSSVSTPRKKIKEVSPIMDENSEAAFYIINYENGGFVILSADNRVSPILAYSETNSFRTNNAEYFPGLVNWLDVHKDYVKAVREKNIEQTPDIKKLWENPSLLVNNDVHPLGEGEGPGPQPACEDHVEEYGPLLLTNWNQDCGYNDQMPVVSCTNTPCLFNNRAYAGCVPVAIAQVMRYHNYPTSYDWSNMPTDNGTAATAQLIRDIWDTIPSHLRSIDCNGTGVSSSHNTGGVFYHFGYSSATKANYSFATVFSSIKNNRPVILSGASGGFGHMWVADGAIEYWQQVGVCPNPVWMVFKYLYMNWGWGGHENGWYSDGNFNPGIYNFNDNRQMVTSIAP
ncbi:C10 family peptidase [Parapedobacter tibetensis]|uniref:C10 family peptidase n=1 Tax=Parapedobacter tibetensis TaxID=2972951 RepID=UPI00214D7D9D|nr:C10 family peptidase [Parapedobacter tibetensis]